MKYISDAFEELYAELQNIPNADPEDKDEYKAENVFFVPEIARWSYLQSKAKLPTIGKEVDNAMEAIEKENPSLKDVLSKVYARGHLDPTSLGGLIDLIGNIALGEAKERSADILGHVFEYFLGEFALAEGKKGGQFYTPRCVVELLVEMLGPYKGRVFDPCCGSGGMFVQSEKFVTEHQGRINDISIYGQESNLTTWRLCKMNLAIRGIDSSQVKWNSEGSFLNDAHKDLKADFVIANPPFNDSDWSGHLLRNDARWAYGVPPIGNANYAWIQHFLYHLSPRGVAGFVLAKGSLTSKTAGEGEIRKELIEARLVDCIVNLPAKLFLNTPIPACLWFLSRNKANGGYRNRKDEILFIDARNEGYLINRRTRVLSHEDIQKIASTYHEWRNENGNYKDIKGFCNSATIERVRELDYVMTPGRYVGLPDEEDDFDFNERFTSFDVPCLHTLYIDKPMRGHNLMQAIARVNRVYKDKTGGLIVDYLGIAADLKEALSFYADSGGRGDPAIVQEEAVHLMLEKLEIVSQMFYGFHYKEYFNADTSKKLSLILRAEEHILGQEDGKKRFIDAVTALSKAFSIAIPHDQAMAIKDEVAFFQAVKSRLVKFDSTGTGKTNEEIETAIR